MAVVVKSTQYDGIQGGVVERGQFTITPGSVTNAAQANISPDSSSVSGQPTCKSGDQIWVNCQTLTTGLVLVGAKVTGTNTVQVTVYNPTAAPVTGLIATVDYILQRLS